MRTPSAFRQVSVAAAILVVWAARVGAQAPGNDKIAATVNGETVTQSELQAVLDLRPSPVPLSKDLEREMRKAAVEMLTDDLLMRQFLRKTVPPANPADVQKEYAKLQEALAKQKKTMEQFLREGKMTPELLHADVVARLQWRTFLNAKYSEAEVKSYYDANKLFFDNVVVRASHILVKVSGNPSPEERQRAKAKLEILRQEILAGKMTFEDAARRYSDCPSKEKGGDIGPFPYKFVVVEAFAQAAYSTKPGAMTDIVTTEFGYHLIKVTERNPGEPSQFEPMRDTVRDVMAQEADLYQRILAEQKKVAKIQVYVQ